MSFFDLRQMDENSLIETDLCIVGSGPAGLSIAKEFEGSNIEVLVLESGGLDKEADTQSLYDIENTGAPIPLDQESSRLRIYGGTSHVWTGRCAPFDDIDFEQRSWVAYSGWPITRPEIDSHLERAGVYLGLGPHCYDENLWPKLKVPQPKPPLDEQFLEPIFWQFSKSPTHPKRAVDFGRDLTFPGGSNVCVLLHSNVTHINVNSDGNKIESVEVSTLENKRSCVRARAVVLACGGIENARLLLASNRVMPRGVGNENDLVGRFLMYHPHIPLGYFDPKDAELARDRFGHYWLDDQQGRHVYLHGLTLSKNIQKEEHLLRCNAYIEGSDIADDDPWEKMCAVASGLRSRRLSRQFFRDCRLAFSHPREIGRGLYRRLGKHRPQFVRAKTIRLDCAMEQMPNPDSRITLSPDTRDALGMPLSRINWIIGEPELQSARRMSQLVCQEFQRLKHPIPRPSPWLTGEGEWIDYFWGKTHPTGTTRLSVNPAEGVVDPNLQVHNIQGLFIAGSSVFPTVGAANPTLMIVAMSLRLADWLKTSYFKSHVSSAGKLYSALKNNYVKATPERPHATVKNSHQRVKVGLVGAGQRMSKTYLPILKDLSSHFEIVGFTTRSTHTARMFESKTGISAYSSASELINQQQPSFLIVAVNPTFLDSTLMKLIDLRVPILAETPLAWSVSAASSIVRKAAANNVPVAVAEQFPYKPIEQFRYQLIKLGVFGDVYAVYNDFESYEYHGIAQLRRYLRGKPTQVQSMEYNFGTDPTPRLQERFSNIRWRIGSVTFDDGSMLFHQFSSHYVVSDLCFPQAIRIYGKTGTMVDYEIRLFNKKTDRIETALATRKENEINTVESIAVTLPEFGVVTWNNPYAAYPFTDDQIAIATLLDGMSQAVRTGCPALYTAEEFVTNIAIFQAFRYSGYRGGARIPLPFKERVHKALVATDLGYWKRKLVRS